MGDTPKILPGATFQAPSIPKSIPDSVHWKLLRAQEHINELGAEVQRYFQKDPAKVVRDENASPDEYIAEITARIGVPGKVPMIVGDFLTNVRSSLDYLVWELVLAAKNHPTEKNMFPICTTQEAFDQQLARHRLDGVPVDAIAEIRALQPYHDGQDAGGHVLAMLDSLCNVNKHRRVLTTILRGQLAPKDFVTETINGQVYGSVNFADLLDQSTKIGPFPMVDGPLGRGPKVDAPLQLVTYVAFNESAAQDVEVGLTLSILGGYVVQELARFAKFFV
jgi:hypothetical protein